MSQNHIVHFQKVTVRTDAGTKDLLDELKQHWGSYTKAVTAAVLLLHLLTFPENAAMLRDIVEEMKRR